MNASVLYNTVIAEKLGKTQTGTIKSDIVSTINMSLIAMPLTYFAVLAASII